MNTANMPDSELELLTDTEKKRLSNQYELDNLKWMRSYDITKYRVKLGPE